MPPAADNGRFFLDVVAFHKMSFANDGSQRQRTDLKFACAALLANSEVFERIYNNLRGSRNAAGTILIGN